MKMPKQWSRRWGRLWHSGAIPRDVVYFAHLADLLEVRLKELDWYYNNIDPQAVRKGLRLTTRNRGFIDLCAVAAQDLHLPWAWYVRLTEQLLGKSAPAIEESWRSMDMESKRG